VLYFGNKFPLMAAQSNDMHTPQGHSKHAIPHGMFSGSSGNT